MRDAELREFAQQRPPERPGVGKLAMFDQHPEQVGA